MAKNTWLENVIKSVSDVAKTTSAIVTQAQTVANKVKGLTMPTVVTNPGGLPATVQATSETAPGVSSPGVITPSSAMPYILLVGGVVVAILLLRK